MAAKGAKEFGFVPHAHQPFAGLPPLSRREGKRPPHVWYDEQLKNLDIANPFRKKNFLFL